MLLLAIFALVLGLVDAGSGSSDEERGNEVATSSECKSSGKLASSESVQCPLCGLCFKNLGVHMMAHKRPKKLSCFQCGKQYTRGSSLRRHERTHSGEKAYDCLECGKQFLRVDVLRRHQQKHGGEIPFLCAECGKQFTYAHDLHAHQRMHTGEKPFTCPDCGEQFAFADRLRSHQQAHTGEKPFVCPECGKHFARFNNLKIHRRKHTGEMPYRCTECGKQFARIDCLRKHEHTHTRVKFHCPVCNKKFRTGDDLQIHQRTHNTTKMSGCSRCGRQFVYAENLRRHLRMHSDEKPFKCSQCEKRFERANYLRGHQRRKHAALKNSTGSPFVHYAENSTVEDNPLAQTVFENSVRSSPPILTVMGNPSFLHPVLEIPVDDTHLAESEVSAVEDDPFLVQNFSKNAADNSSFSQIDSPTELESPFLYQVENPMYEPSLSENPMESSFILLHNPVTLENLFLFKNPMDNPSLVQKEEGAVLEELIGSSPHIQADAFSVPEASIDSPSFFPILEHIPTSAECDVREVLSFSDDSDAAPGSTDLECPVCFGRFGKEKALEEHLQNNSCSLFPPDWLPHLQSGDSDDGGE